MDEKDQKRTRSDTPTRHYEKMNEFDLLSMLKDNKSLLDEADIVHYLYETKFGNLVF